MRIENWMTIGITTALALAVSALKAEAAFAADTSTPLVVAQGQSKGAEKSMGRGNADFGQQKAAEARTKGEKMKEAADDAADDASLKMEGGEDKAARKAEKKRSKTEKRARRQQEKAERKGDEAKAKAGEAGRDASEAAARAQRGASETIRGPSTEASRAADAVIPAEK